MERTRFSRGKLNNLIGSGGIAGGFKTTPPRDPIDVHVDFNPTPITGPIVPEPIPIPIGIPEYGLDRPDTAEPDWGKLLQEIETSYPSGVPPGPEYAGPRIIDEKKKREGNGGNGGPFFPEEAPSPGKIPLNQFTEAWTQEQGSEEGIDRGYSAGGGGTYSTGGGGGGFQQEQPFPQEIPYKLLIYGFLGVIGLYLLTKGKK